MASGHPGEIKKAHPQGWAEKADYKATLPGRLVAEGARIPVGVAKQRLELLRGQPRGDSLTVPFQGPKIGELLDARVSPHADPFQSQRSRRQRRRRRQCEPGRDRGRPAAHRTGRARDSGRRRRRSRSRRAAGDAGPRRPHVRRAVRRPARRPAAAPAEVLHREVRRGGAGPRHQLQQHVRAPHAAVHGQGPHRLSAQRQA